MTNMNPVKYKLKHSTVFVRKVHGLDQLPTPLIIRIIIPPQSSSFFTIIIILVINIVIILHHNLHHCISEIISFFSNHSSGESLAVWKEFFLLNDKYFGWTVSNGQEGRSYFGDCRILYFGDQGGDHKMGIEDPPFQWLQMPLGFWVANNTLPSESQTHTKTQINTFIKRHRDTQMHIAPYQCPLALWVSISTILCFASDPT